MKHVSCLMVVFGLALLVLVTGCVPAPLDPPTTFPYGDASCWQGTYAPIYGVNSNLCVADQRELVDPEWTRLDATTWEYRVTVLSRSTTMTCTQPDGSTYVEDCYSELPDGTVTDCTSWSEYEIYHYTSTCSASDDRINWQHGDTYAIIYPRRDDTGKPDLHIYCVDPAGNGTLGLIVTQEMIDKVSSSPDQNTQNAEIVSTKCMVPIGVYRLTSGEFQVNIGPDIEGKMDVVTFKGLPPTHVHYDYFNTFDGSE